MNSLEWVTRYEQQQAQIKKTSARVRKLLNWLSPIYVATCVGLAIFADLPSKFWIGVWVLPLALILFTTMVLMLASPIHSFLDHFVAKVPEGRLRTALDRAAVALSLVGSIASWTVALFFLE